MDVLRSLVEGEMGRVTMAGGALGELVAVGRLVRTLRNLLYRGLLVRGERLRLLGCDLVVHCQWFRQPHELVRCRCLDCKPLTHQKGREMDDQNFRQTSGRDSTLAMRTLKASPVV